MADASHRLPHPTVVWNCLALALPAVLWMSYPALPPRVTLAIAVILLIFAGFINRRSTLYPHTYRAAPVGALGFLACLSLICASFGDAAYDRLWRRAFQLEGDWSTFQAPGEKWSAMVPTGWNHVSEDMQGGRFHVFRPSKTGQTLYFSVMQRAMGKEKPEDTVKDFLLRMGRERQPDVIDNRDVTYNGVKAHKFVYRNLAINTVRESHVILMWKDKNLFLVTVAGSTANFRRFSPELNTLLNNLRLSA